jgi:hypothetical protein
MKVSLMIVLAALPLSAFAKSAERVESFCRVTFVEDGVEESKDFKFKCDNYGQGATFESAKKRFTATAFSEESCTPQLVVYDSKSKTSSASVALDEVKSPFDVFKDRLVIAVLNAEVEKDDVLDNSSSNRALIACSSKKELLDNLD